jgi:glucose-6-phosphate dehydrogenase assembly protein OpcA
VLTGAPQHEPEVASAVLGLLVTELPVAVWLMGEPALGGLGSRLFDEGDMVIVDSGRAHALAGAYAAIAAIEQEHTVGCLDLAWARIGAWRALVAQMFDGDAGTRELQQITHIDVSGGAGAGAFSSDALLLGAWIASRLDFTLADATARDGAVHAALYDGTRGVRLTIVPGAMAFDRLSLRTPDAEFVLERHGESGHVRVRETWDSGATHRLVERPPDDDGTMLAQLLDGTGDLATYRDAAGMARSVLAASAPDA